MTQSFSGPVSVDQIQSLSTPQLALGLLKALVRQGGERIGVDNIFKSQYYLQQRDSQHLLSRLADAWAWLESHGLVSFDPSQGFSSSYRRVTDVGRAIAVDDHALTKLWAGERLMGEFDDVLASALTNFHFGDYQTACFAAMKEVEIAVRKAAGLGNRVIGVNVMRQAFNPAEGPLRDTNAESAEQQAVMELFSGAIGAFKNPNSHRAVDYDDPVEAAEIIQLADLLLRLLRRAQSVSE